MSAETLTLPPTPPLDLPPVVDEPGKKPTTRAGRAARSAAAAAKRADAPPKTPKITAPKKGNVAESVQGLHELAGGLALPLMGLPATGAALVATGGDAGKAWAALAQRYPAVERMFTTGGDGGLFVSLIMAYLPVMTAAMAEAKTPKEMRGGGLAGLDPSLLAAFMPAQAGAPVAEAA